jgi:hypothetical protein
LASSSLLQEHDWLVEHHSEAEKHAGRWIAILQGKMVAEGRTYEQAYRKAIKGRAGATPLVTYVPRKDEELLILLGAL